MKAPARDQQPGGLRLLVVDDDEVDRLAVRRCLQATGMSVLVEQAATADEARDRLAAASCDCILLDYHIPGVEGLDLLHAIQQVAPDTPVIMLTGQLDDEIAAGLMKGGAADYLSKAALTPQRLASSLRFALGLMEARSAQRRAEKALHEQREWLEVTLNSIGDAVVATDTAGVVTFMNPVACALTGWPQVEAEGRPLSEVFRIVREETGAPMDNPALLAMAQGRVVSQANHTVLTARSGNELAIDNSGSPIRDASGGIIGAVLIFRDITSQRRMEREREEQGAATQLLAAIVESSEDAILSQSLDGVVQSCNAAAERLFACPAKQILGRTVAAFIPADRPDEEDRILARIRTGERITYFDTVRLRADGRQVPVGLTISPVYDAVGSIVGVSKIARDITARKRTESLLRLLGEAAQHLLAAGDPQELVRGLFEKIREPLGVDAYFNHVVDDAEGTLFLESFAGITEEAAGTVFRLAFGEAICGTAAAERRAIHAMHIQQSDESMVQTVKPLGIRAYVCHPMLAEYRLLGTLSFASTSKDEFSAEEIDFLRTVSRFATAAYDRLRCVRALRQIDARKDEFLATLAHELRNPLAPIRNVLELMKRSTAASEDQLRKGRDTMERQVGLMVRLVDDLLDVSRIGRDKLELRWENVMLASVVAQAVEAARPLADSGRHELSVELPPEPIALRADAGRLAQVFGNLLVNACKYTEPGGRIRVTAKRQGSDVLVGIKDNGIGIAPDQLAAVFDLFSQVQSARSRSQGGLGIGLTLVKRLAELHGGSVEARSEGPGRGSEFVVRLAVVDAQLHSASCPSVPEAATTAGHRILVVDDNVDAAESLASLLELAGHTTATAHDGLAAVGTVDRFRPDVVLMDIGLPKLDGCEAGRLIRSLPRGDDILLVALTGWGQEQDRRRCKEAGFDEHMVKPVDFGALAKLLGERRSTDPQPLVVTAIPSGSAVSAPFPKAAAEVVNT